MMYILFANIEYKNGDFERKVIKDFVAHMLEELAHEDFSTRMVP